jgi:hypothetical protein
MRREKEKKGKCWNSVGYIKAGLLILLFTMVSAGLLLPGFANAEEGYGPGTDRFKINLGAYFPAISTDIQVDIGDSPIDLENGLGLSENETVLRLDGYWRFAKKHRLGFGYYRLNRDARKVLSGDLEIGDEIWYGGALVDSDLSLDFYQLNYMYSFYQGEKWEIGGTIGAYWVRVENTIALAAEISSPQAPNPPGTPIQVGERFESDTFEGPLPLIGLVFEYYITPKWMATLRGGYFQLTYNNYKGSIGNLGASVEYQFTKTFGLGLGYDAFKLTLDAEDANSNDFASIEYQYHGVQVYGVLRF